MNFQPPNPHTSSLFKKFSVLKFKLTLILKLFYLSANLLINFYLLYLVVVLNFSRIHNYETSWFSHANLEKPSHGTNIYGKNFIIVSGIDSLNKMLYSKNIMKLISNEYLKNCWTVMLLLSSFIFVFIITLNSCKQIIFLTVYVIFVLLCYYLALGEKDFHT